MIEILNAGVHLQVQKESVSSVCKQERQIDFFVCFSYNTWAATWRLDLVASSGLFSGKNFTFQIQVTWDYSCQLKYMQRDMHKAD